LPAGALNFADVAFYTQVPGPGGSSSLSACPFSCGLSAAGPLCSLSLFSLEETTYAPQVQGPFSLFAESCTLAFPTPSRFSVSTLCRAILKPPRVAFKVEFKPSQPLLFSTTLSSPSFRTYIRFSWVVRPGYRLRETNPRLLKNETGRNPDGDMLEQIGRLPFYSLLFPISETPLLCCVRGPPNLSVTRHWFRFFFSLSLFLFPMYCVPCNLFSLADRDTPRVACRLILYLTTLEIILNCANILLLLILSLEKPAPSPPLLVQHV